MEILKESQDTFKVLLPQFKPQAEPAKTTAIPLVLSRFHYAHRLSGSNEIKFQHSVTFERISL